MYGLCTPCLKRLGLEGSPSRCEICGGIFERVDALLRVNYKAEFSTFNVGIRLDPEREEKEREIMERLQLSGEKTLKRELILLIRKKLEEKFEKKIELQNPDVVFIVDLEKETIQPIPSPLYIKGRYTKTVRTIPQTKWHCKRCRGKGCSHCNFTGKIYETSVEEIIGAVFLEHTKGKEERFHGAGREDIDAQMLGDGRPFVIEIRDPCVRSVDLERIASEVNQDERVQVRELEHSHKKEVVRLKEGKFDKTYLARLNDEITDEEALALRRLHEIHQQTPRRVSHRRANKIRIRKVYKVERKSSNCLEICCESGLYVKELITGDDGRTVPSVSSVVQRDLECIALDVVKIHDR